MKLHKLVAAVMALAVLAPVVAVVAAPSAQGQTYSVLHSFAGMRGQEPYAGLIQDKDRNFYGTTLQGGASGAGVVFQLKENGKEKVLYNFTGGADGAQPYAGLVQDSTGNLYGTTYRGGNPACNCGTVFKVDTSGDETVLSREGRTEDFLTGVWCGTRPGTSMARPTRAATTRVMG